jgi:hypothetical protein
MLDEIGLEHERFDLGLADENLDVANLRDHFFLGERERTGIAKIRLHARREIFRLADVDDLSSRVLHLIHSGRFRKRLEHIRDAVACFFNFYRIFSEKVREKQGIRCNFRILSYNFPVVF